MHLSRDLREFVGLLNTNGVEYLVVGAFAVAWHGHPRFTRDFLIRADDSNARLVLATLANFGFASLQIVQNDLNRPHHQVIQLVAQPNRIDLITSIEGVEFDQAWKNRVRGSLDGIPVFYIGIDDLIRNKESTGRGKDLGDAEELKKRRRSS